MIGIEVIGVQQIDFAIVLVFHRHFHGRQASTEPLRQKLALGFGSIGVGTPAHINFAKVIDRLPVSRFQQSPYSGPVAAGRTAENPVSGLFTGFFCRQAGLFQFGGLCQYMLSHIVLFRGFFLRRSQGDRLFHPLHGKRHCVAEQSADPRCHIDTGTSQFLQGNDFQADYPAAAFLPNRSNPQKVEELGDALTPAAHIGSAPQDNPDALRIMTFFGDKPFN